MKVSIAQLNYKIGDFESNTKKIIGAINTAKKEGAKLVVFSELAISGYPPEDFLDYHWFLEKQDQYLNLIKKECTGITAVLGAITRNKGVGRGLFNSALVIEEGEVKHCINKTLLPTYDIFNECRYFEPNKHFNRIEIEGKKVAVTICEDLWSKYNDFEYKIDVLEQYKDFDLVVNIAASPYNQDKFEVRDTVLRENSSTYHTPLIYVNQVGAHTDIVFDGNSSVWNSGKKVLELPSFKEEINTFDLEGILLNKEVTNEYYVEKEHVLDAIVFGIKEYFSKMGFTKCLLGSSGGIDSAVVQALATLALGGGNVHAVLMPSEFSSDGSINDAEQLSKNCKNLYGTIPIKGVYNSYLDALEPIFKGTKFNIAEENLQARARGMMLMAISNKKGGILLNTSNKSEMSVGYSTLYGDMCGGLAPIGDLYKMEVYALAKFINKKHGLMIPEEIINKEPSAELRPDQKDSDSLPIYPILDKILYQYIEERKSPQEIVSSGIEEAVVLDVLGKINRNEYKRYQAAPVIRVSKKAFGYGRRMPLVGKYF
jgi:NAD+ synthase (glutamine-hydrolysing)